MWGGELVDDPLHPFHLLIVDKVVRDLETQLHANHRDQYKAIEKSRIALDCTPATTLQVLLASFRVLANDHRS